MQQVQSLSKPMQDCTKFAIHIYHSYMLSLAYNCSLLYMHVYSTSTKPKCDSLNLMPIQKHVCDPCMGVMIIAIRELTYVTA